MNDKKLWDGAHVFCKEQTILYAVNYDKYKLQLNGRPYRRTADLALVYQQLIRNTKDALVTVQVTDAMLTDGITEEELFAAACENSRYFLPPVVENIKDILKECVLDDFFDAAGGNVEQALTAAEDTKQVLLEKNKEDTAMYVITNASRMHGAAAIFYSDVLEELSSKLQSDLLILPSSIHEVLALPYMDASYDEAFLNMVAQANKSVVLPGEFLSNSIYRYDRLLKELCEIH